MKPTKPNYVRCRVAYFVAVLVTIVLGLASRNLSLLPAFVEQHAGDTLWAMMVYFGIRFLFMQKSRHFAILFSFLFCFSIEISQLYQGDWINQIRGTLLGALILGRGFLAVDLVRYAVGILIGAALDRVKIS